MEAQVVEALVTRLFNTGRTDGFDVERDVAGPGLGEGLEVHTRVCDHQVDVEVSVGERLAEGLAEGGAHGEVGDEVAIHDIQVEPRSGALVQDLAGTLRRERSEVGGEGWRGRPVGAWGVGKQSLGALTGTVHCNNQASATLTWWTYSRTLGQFEVSEGLEFSKHVRDSGVGHEAAPAPK